MKGNENKTEIFQIYYNSIANNKDFSTLEGF
jgi:hypothetical protein